MKFLGSNGSGYISDATDAVFYATRLGVHLTSNSWGGGGYSQAFADAFADADQHGVLFVAAAGNSAANNDSSPHYPSSYSNPNVIAVAATDHNDQLASFSSYGGTSVDLGAPGVNVLSCTLGSQYGLASGTSMATPHVSGVCALLKALAPAFTHQDIKARLLSFADPIPALQGKCVSGGRLNVYRALSAGNSPLVRLKASQLLDSPGGSVIGNGDGIANPGEQVGLRVVLRNESLQPAEEVAAVLSLVSADPHVAILQNTVNLAGLRRWRRARAAGTF